MSKKEVRVKYLAGIYAALDETEMGADGKCVYPKEKIQQVLETVKHLLAEDGVKPLNS